MGLLVNKTKQKELGAFYTSNIIVKYMVDNTLNKIEITKDTRILEPSCGDGNFLLYIKEYLLNLNFSLNEIEDMVYGVDIDKETVEKCIANIGFSKNIKCNNTLLMDFNLKFDVVIGNPPYLRVQGIDKEVSTQYKKEFKSATGSYDLYVLFVEKGLSLLAKDGILNFIMPYKWINSSFGKGLREISKDKVSKFISLERIKSLMPPPIHLWCGLKIAQMKL